MTVDVVLFGGVANGHRLQLVGDERDGPYATTIRVGAYDRSLALVDGPDPINIYESRTVYKIICLHQNHAKYWVGVDIEDSRDVFAVMLSAHVSLGDEVNSKKVIY